MSTFQAWARFLRSSFGPGAGKSFALAADEGRNQAAHIALGIIACGVAHFALVGLTGVIASKLLIIALALCIPLAVEAVQARGRGWRPDAWRDVAFWKIGIVGTALTFNEGTTGQLVGSPLAFFGSVAFAALALALHINKRVVREYGAD